MPFVCYDGRMNTLPHATTVLCFGDSNTWGQRSDRKGRYAPDVRWTGKLQETLGEQYYVIEEGLSSRTTNLDYSRKPGRNGRTYLVPCLASHNPLDYVVMMLGTNDLKIEFDRSAHDIAEALRELVQEVQATAKGAHDRVPKIILISPILVDNTAPYFAENYTEHYDQESVVKSRQLADEVARIARETDCIFLDAATVAKAGVDGIHFDEASHAALAQLVSVAILG